MAATATLRAILGVETDGAERSLDSFSVKLSTIKRAITAGFAVWAVRQFVSAIEDVKRFQSDTGIKLMSDDDLRNVDRAGDKIRMLSMQLKAAAVSFGAQIMAGVTALSDYVEGRLLGLSSYQAWARAGDKMTAPTQSELRAAAVAAKRQEAEKAQTEKDDREAKEKRIAALRQSLADGENRQAVKNAKTNEEKLAVLARQLDAAGEAYRAEGQTDEQRLNNAKRLRDVWYQIQDIEREAAQDAKKEMAGEQARQENEELRENREALDESNRQRDEEKRREGIIAHAEASAADVMANTPTQRMESDMYSRIGGAIGGRGDLAVNIAMRQLEVLQRIEAIEERADEELGLG